MTEAERLQAAKEKLEALRAEVELGDLTVTRFTDKRNEDVWVDSDYTHVDGVRSIRTAIVFDRSQGPKRFKTAEYVVTLHRTIDAQLAILTQGLRYVRVGIRFGAIETTALALADAILGGDQ